MACSALPLEITRNRLTPCYYLALYCRHCSEIRAAVPEAPSDRFHPGPACRRESEYALLGEGGTQRALPFWRKDSLSRSEMIAAHWRAQKVR